MGLSDATRLALGRRLRLAQREGRVPSLVAALARGTEVLWSEAVGLAEVGGKRQPTLETQYRLGSITKTVTAAAILQLRDAGRLGLDDPLERHLGPGAHGGATIRQLLCHRAGLQREPPGEMWESMAAPGGTELLSLAETAEVVLPRGQRWHYSNLGFGLLGQVVGRCAGRAYEQVVDEGILSPLGMRRTTWAPVAPAAHGYTVDPYVDRARPEPPVDIKGLASAGQLWSSATDLLRWGAFLCAPSTAVLAPATVDEMHLPQAIADPERWTRGWGLGPMLHRRGERIFGGHNGAMPGFLASLVYSRPQQLVVALLTNAGSGIDIGATALDLLEEGLGGWVQEPGPWEPEVGPSSPVEALLGRWWSEGSEWIFRLRHGELQAVMAGAAPTDEVSRFVAEGPDSFRTVSGGERGERLRVVRGPGGAVIKLYWATYPFLRTASPTGEATPPD